MIDGSDGDFVFLASGGSLLGLAIAIILWVIAAGNADDCAKRQCSVPGQSGHLIDHECVCVEDAR